MENGNTAPAPGKCSRGYGARVARAGKAGNGLRRRHSTGSPVPRGRERCGHQAAVDQLQSACCLFAGQQDVRMAYLQRLAVTTFADEPQTGGKELLSIRGRRLVHGVALSHVRKTTVLPTTTAEQRARR